MLDFINQEKEWRHLVNGFLWVVRFPKFREKERERKDSCFCHPFIFIPENSSMTHCGQRVDGVLRWGGLSAHHTQVCSWHSQKLCALFPRLFTNHHKRGMISEALNASSTPTFPINLQHIFRCDHRNAHFPTGKPRVAWLRPNGVQPLTPGEG